MFEFGPKQTKWLELLEKGKLPQVKGALCQVNVRTGKVIGFCCLGVAEAGVMKHKPRVLQSCISRAENEVKTTVDVMFDQSTGSLSNSTRNAMKFRSDMGASGDYSPTLAALNDSGVSFKAIAKKVRANPTRYFTEPA